jgi:hypothetical protein
MQWLGKGFFLIMDARSLDAASYSDFLSILVAPRKSL